ncbi:leucyl/phenylalanyl-tRNA--protein transferase [Sphingosinicella terrae]|uniref:leucyl/phenylalanyl-tRNA--protein transferase n=1 Tax=Sphingosinicella terrae TaxID=2172047 RepID=UPI000E0D8404|nr:leucyl/phenylalanyl-tRNA--protein transferase [Sphingosinicella terrae]
MSVLDPDLLLRAYAIGVFPMSDSRDAREVYWVEPRRRAILPLDRFHLSRSLRKRLRSGEFEVTHDRAFEEVVRHCADRDDTWINEPIERSYNLLHSSGHAHSVEAWHEGELVGGLYGVRLGAAFFGESMFSRRTDASKVTLAWLVARLIVGGFQLLDCQFMTDHLRRLGAVEIDQKVYLALLASALGAGGSAAGAAGASAAGVGAAEFGALDRLLAGRPAGSPPSGCVIAQLLGQTS